MKQKRFTPHRPDMPQADPLTGSKANATKPPSHQVAISLIIDTDYHSTLAATEFTKGNFSSQGFRVELGNESDVGFH